MDELVEQVNKLLVLHLLGALTADKHVVEHVVEHSSLYILISRADGFLKLRELKQTLFIVVLTSE